MDINSLNTRELTQLISEATKRKKVLAKRKPINQVRASVNRIVRTSGYTFEELFGVPAPKATKRATRKTTARKSTGKVPPKYRDPANPENTWTGRGRQPLWLVAYTDAGRDVNEFLIDKA
ncbi:H-NS histone family protein [Luteimonas sp. e5]